MCEGTRMTLQTKELFNGEWIVYISDQNMNHVCAAIFSTEPRSKQVHDWIKSFVYFDL